MIEQVLNRQFVFGQLQAVNEAFARGILEQRRGLNTPYEPSPEEWMAAANAMQRAEAREEKDSSGQPAFEVQKSPRRGEDPPPLDDVVFISRDPVIGLLQSALEEYFETHNADAITADAPTGGNRRGAVDEILVTDRSLANCSVVTQPLDGRRVFGQFSETDASWVACKVAEGIRWFNGKHAFNDSPASPLAIADNARLILVGDWGSGLPRAQKVANEMRRILNDGKDNRLDQHVIHLGDVYYSGWQYEYENRFLAYWPVRLDEAESITSWSLNGNHDMYSGGHGFFDYLLADPRFAHQERSSYFSLVNKNWQILGIDTAYEDGGLHGPQGKWVHELVSAKKKKTMLLSHHQLFSAYESGSERVEAALHDVLTGPVPIDAWFWGHEHRCICYDSFKNVRNARLIGHGGVPVYMLHKEGDPYRAPARYEFRDYISKMFGIEHFALFGFAVLDFEGPKVRVRYIDENGREHFDEVIE